MGVLSCFSGMLPKKKPKEEILESGDSSKGNGRLQVEVEQFVNTSKVDDGSKGASFNVLVPFEIQGTPTCKVKVLEEDKFVGVEVREAAYEGEDEHDEYENSSMKRDFSDFDLQAQGEEPRLSFERSNGDHLPSSEGNHISDEEGTEVIQSGHVSDPGIGRTAIWGSPKLKRSCSNLETSDLVKRIATATQWGPSNSHSFEDLEKMGRRESNRGLQSSPRSIITSCSADKVMLKKCSSTQILPSRSRRLWWKLFLWSHRNLHKLTINPQASNKHSPARKSSKQRYGYDSDTLETSLGVSQRNKEVMGNPNLESPESYIHESKNNNWDSFQTNSSGFWGRNQWVAFSSESTNLARVDEWVNTLDTDSVIPVEDQHAYYVEGEKGKGVFYPPSLEKHPHTTTRSTLNEEVLQANSIVQSLNSVSSVAHIAGMGLKVIPNLAPFSSLRSVNLSGNFIAQVTPGSLPKSLHSLNLSRNKITTIEGLRELTRLRIIDLSYNRITRIGHGLSNCTLIKELYLSGNKISDVEGLHRLLKLTVLDLSFNKITTSKALGQLVANYNSLMALNLLGNPIQGNMGDDQMRKTVSSLLPQLVYLNRQAIKPQRAREVVMDSVAKAALGKSSWNSRRKPPRRVSQASSSGRVRSSEAGDRRVRHRSRSSYNPSPARRLKGFGQEVGSGGVLPQGTGLLTRL